MVAGGGGWGATVLNIRLTYKGEQGGGEFGGRAPGASPLNPRLETIRK